MNHGRHIKVFGRGHSALLNDSTRVEAFLVALVEKLGMRALGAPVIHNVELDITKRGLEPFEDEGGTTGIIVLSTSHVAVHTWPAKHLFILDVFSCRDFDPEDVMKTLFMSFASYGEKVVHVDVSFPEAPVPSVRA